MTQKVILIWAEAYGVIGKDGKLPWHIPEDLAFFKSLTTGHPIIMGRKTWESLPNRPLPGRRSIVITGQHDYQAEGAEVVSSLEEAFELAATQEEDVYVIGGGEIFQDAEPFATDAVVTEIDLEVEGDRFAPILGWYNGWEVKFTDPEDGGWFTSREGNVLFRTHHLTRS